MPSPPTSPDDYTVGWISAIQTEYVIACELLDEEYDPLPLNSFNDNNVYTFGRIGSHHVVLACLPKGRYGLTSATSVAKDMLRTFPSLRFGLMVGIGGAASTENNDIRLGDVVVSTPVGNSGGVIHYEFGKAIQNKAFLRTGTLNSPPPLLLSATHQLSSLHERRGHQITRTISEIVKGNSRLQKYLRPKTVTDVLYKASFVHSDPNRQCADICNDPHEIIIRPSRGVDQDDPVVHYGLIASADRLMKDAQARNALAEDENILCFEMEAAGLMDNFPCVVIRGICDYSDTHKNDAWQSYASATAAAYARELLMIVPTGRPAHSLAPKRCAQTPGTIGIANGNTDYLVDAPNFPKSLFTVPFERDPLFVSRDSIFSTIENRLRENHRAVLYGLGGTGKSQITIEFAYRYHQRYPGSHVFWIHAATPSRVIDACQDIARRLRLPGSEDPSKDMYNLLARWLDNEENGSWLLVVDGADDSDMILGQDLLQEPRPERLLTIKPLIEFLPRRLDPSRQLLFTTRNRDIADSVVNTSSPIHIGPFSRKEARLLLLRRLEKKTHTPSGNVINKILGLLGYIPLAITQAAAFVNRNGGDVQQHLLAFEHNESDRKLQLSIELQDHRRERGVPNSIFRTWKLSFDQIKQRDAEAADLLSLMSLLDGQSIPETLIKGGQNNNTAWRHSLGTILGYSLATQGHDGTVTMHPLVQMSVRYWLEYENRTAKYVSEVMQLLASKFPTGEYENRAACQVLWPQAETALQYLITCDKFGAILLHKMAWFEWTSGYFEQAENHIRRSYDARRQLFGETSLESLSTLSLMATILQARGKYAAAEETQQRALKGRQEALGVDHPDTIRTANNLATILRDSGKYDAAEAMHRQALDSRERIFGPNHPSTLVSVNNLGLLLRDQGKYEAAEEMHRRALQGQEKVLGPHHPSTLTKLNNLARVLVDQGNYADAEELHRRALEGREKVLGFDHPDALKSVNDLGTVLTNQGKFEEAEEVYRRAFEGRKKALGQSHPDTLKSMNNLATVLVRQDKLREAEEMHRAALEGRERVLGMAHPDTLRSVRDVAYLSRVAGRLEDAVVHYERALKGFQLALGASHPATVNCLRDYERLKDDMDDRDSLETRIEGNKRRKVYRTGAKMGSPGNVFE